MRIDLRYAGLTPEWEQRVKLAAHALTAYKIVARIDAWDGTACDVVIADASDGYGIHVIDIARRRGRSSVLMIGGTTGQSDLITDPVLTLSVPSVATVLTLTRALHRMLVHLGWLAEEPAEPVEPMTRADAAIEAIPSALTQLAAHGPWAGKDVAATIHGMTVWLLPSAGRVLSASMSDQVRAREKLDLDGWQFRLLNDAMRAYPIGEVAVSLDAFYLQGAWRMRQKLPLFPSGNYGLKDWPDLGTAADFADALNIVALLLRKRLDPVAIADAMNIPIEDVSAYLWAFSASGLLEGHDVEIAAPVLQSSAKPMAAQGLLSRLAKHFGLRRS